MHCCPFVNKEQKQNLSQQAGAVYFQIHRSVSITSAQKGKNFLSVLFSVLSPSITWPVVISDVFLLPCSVWMGTDSFPVNIQQSLVLTTELWSLAGCTLVSLSTCGAEQTWSWVIHKSWVLLVLLLLEWACIILHSSVVTWQQVISILGFFPSQQCTTC